MAGLKELAQSLGLSMTTVSRALDGYSDVSVRTRARVQEAAASAGYSPNAAARRLRRQRTDLVVMPLPVAAGRVGTSHLTDMVVGCREVLAGARLNLMIAPVSGPEDELNLCHRLIDGQRVDAMLLVRTRRQDPRVEYLLDRKIPFVTDGRTESVRPHPWLDGDGLSGFHAATQRMIAEGHRRIALIGGDEALFFAHDRAEGYRRAMANAGLAGNVLEAAGLTEAGGNTATLSLMTRADPPTAILCITDTVAIGALAALRSLGAACAIVGHDDLSIGAWTQPALSSMRMDGEDIGQGLGHLLLRALEGEPPAALNALLPVIPVDRESHRTLPART